MFLMKIYTQILHNLNTLILSQCFPKELSMMTEMFYICAVHMWLLNACKHH